MPLCIPHFKMFISLLVLSVVVRWICKMGQLPFFVKYAAELKQGLASPCHIAPNNHFVLLWVIKHEPREAIPRRANMSRLLVFLSDWCCSFSQSLSLSGTHSALQTGGGIKTIPWHHCQVFFKRLSRTFQVQLNFFFSGSDEFPVKKVNGNINVYNLTAWSKPS